MDFSKLTLGSKVLSGAGLLLLLDSFLHWQEVSIPVSIGVSMWHGWGIVVGLTLLVILAWDALQSAEVKVSVGPLSQSMVTMVLSALLVLFTLIKVLHDSDVTVWAWIGLALSIGVAIGAWLSGQEVGASQADPKPANAEVPEAGSGSSDPA
jgi:hypothetical protein